MTLQKLMFFVAGFVGCFGAHADFTVAKAECPIGVFDSGVGGLTVLEKLLSVDVLDNASGKPGADGIPDLQGERFTFLGDQANLPYGNYAGYGKSAFLRELAIRNALFLTSDGFYNDAAEEIGRAHV